MTEHVFESLPWFINGSLPAADQIRIAHHLEHCAQCHAELVLQRHLHAAINQSSKVELAPQQSFNKLWDKIAADEFAQAPSATSRRADASTGLSARALHWFVEHWMPMTLAVQAMAIAVLVATVFVVPHVDNASNTGGGAYRTVTSSIDTTSSTIIHVVFDGATRLADVKDILVKSNLQVVSGPTAAGVYALSPAIKIDQVAAQETIHSLREDPRVRFAELSHL